MNHLKDIATNGLYEPSMEHDACGVGLVADITGAKSHNIIKEGLEVLCNLHHRGAAGSDPETGDGAGILVQIPHALIQQESQSEDYNLPESGDYAVGMAFLPPKKDLTEKVKSLMEDAIRESGMSLITWRKVPVNSKHIGRDARKVAPAIWQCLIARNDIEPDTFEQNLYVLRKDIESKVSSMGLPEDQLDYFYICSLSSMTLVYKGLLLSDQVDQFYLDLQNEASESAVALVHSRFSTNTLGHWKLAHPYRYLAHNGEINTVRGNINWMKSREPQFKSDVLGDNVSKIAPVTYTGASDTASFDNGLELLLMTGRSLDHSLMMMIPEAWEQNESISPTKKAFYKYHSSMMEPWDGPAMIVAADGKRICAVLDRNGLRPFRYTVTKSGKLVMSSETGVLPIPPEEIELKGRLQPGKMFLVDLQEGRIIGDEEVKQTLSEKHPYEEWIDNNSVELKNTIKTTQSHLTGETLLNVQKTYGYTEEEIRMLLTPMGNTAYEPIGSMGNDAPLAILSREHQILYNYFKQLFAQVTNPPLDAIREELVTSIAGFIGCQRNLFDELPEHCNQLWLQSPILSNDQLEEIKQMNEKGVRSATASLVYDPEKCDLKTAIENLKTEVVKIVQSGVSIVVLSDRGINEHAIPIPTLLATSATHHELIQAGLRTKAGLVIESAEPREVMHICLLIGYGAGAINPYGGIATVRNLSENNILQSDSNTVEHNYIKAAEKGILKVMSKMGISTVQSYRGAQIFEAIGLNDDFINEYFTGTSSRIGGIGLDVIESESVERHHQAFNKIDIAANRDLEMGGQYQWRRNGEFHQWNPESISKLQFAAKTNSHKIYKEFSKLSDDQTYHAATIRGMLEFTTSDPSVPIESVEPASEIVKRFATGAISLGSISKEAHETLAIAMNRIGGRSNTGEGGEDPVRYKLDSNGDSRNSAIKQVASGRFGVTPTYLINATDLQIKMAQGAKPGEGGQLPGHKVDDYIGQIRKTTPGVELISPPPHHDIYSIEDLAQLIHDLKNANPSARIQVKLVSEVGVGTIAAGVSKGHGDVVLISGHDGGTGASPESSIKHAGTPWEIGLAETQQVLVANDLRSRIVVQTDGQLKTGRDVAIAALLGAEEFGIATAALIVNGCIMLKKCHLNTCSVGIATQDPELRKQFSGKPEYLINYFYFVAEELREIMAELGFNTVAEMVGRMDKLKQKEDITEVHPKLATIDLSKLLYMPKAAKNVNIHCTDTQDHGLDQALDKQLIEVFEDTIKNQSPKSIELDIYNSNRTFGAMLSGQVAKYHGDNGLPANTINIKLNGSAGQSFGAFLSEGITINLHGDSNDYLAKGMAGGKITVVPPTKSTFQPEDNIIIGNVAMYGATGGEAYIYGKGGERFAVRNSGGEAVIEGVGDHCCEYMTGGVVVILGETGRNFAAGMSGGIAYVYDKDGTFHSRFNSGLADLEELRDTEDKEDLKRLISNHNMETNSNKAKFILENWDTEVSNFKKVMPRDYKRVLEERAEEASKG
ncbi:MAG: glutamate synthase large subunit [SAR202 cluster bacterium]|nr:glutamate synthase large subunit [SAR202 cluster bacterium]|tara:strand:+ start:244 stop:4764 length:4521 start_codon:yes stop_codon:yes gene_type:complete